MTNPIDNLERAVEHEANKPKTVNPVSFEGWNMSIAQLFGSGPKFTITCGNCRGTFRKRVPVVYRPGVPCDHCGAVNIMPLVWEAP